MRKENFGGTKPLKKLFKQRKMHSRPSYRTDRHRDLEFRYTEARKASTLAVQGSKQSWKEFGRRMDSAYFFVKQSILADHLLFTWQAIECYLLHQKFWK